LKELGELKETVPTYPCANGDTSLNNGELYGLKFLLAWQAAGEMVTKFAMRAVRHSLRHFKVQSQMVGTTSSARANLAEGHCRKAFGDYFFSGRSPWFAWRSR